MGRELKQLDNGMYQVWETVSDGSPVSPELPSKGAIVDYLTTQGDWWDQERKQGPWALTAAEQLVALSWLPTGMVKGNTFYPTNQLPIIDTDLPEDKTGDKQ